MISQTRIKNVLDFIEKELSKMPELENPIRSPGGLILKFSFSCNPNQCISICPEEELIHSRGTKKEVVVITPSGWALKSGIYKIKSDNTINLGWVKKNIKEKWNPYMARKALDDESNAIIREAGKLKIRSIATIIESMTNDNWIRENTTAISCFMKLQKNNGITSSITSAYAHSDNSKFALSIANLSIVEIIVALKAIAENVED